MKMKEELIKALKEIKEIHMRLLEKWEKENPYDDEAEGMVAIQELFVLIQGKGFEDAALAIFKEENPDIYS